jgi:hypothetical protein
MFDFSYRFVLNTAPLAEAWDEARTAFRPELLLRGQTYRQQVLFDTAPIAHDVVTVAYDDPRVAFDPSRAFC